MTLPRAFYDIPLAHRALHDVNDGRPENSRAAIQAAVASGYGIEVDLQLSADNVAMVFHDYSLGRLTDDSGEVRLRSSTELSAIPLTGGSEGMPTLRQVLEIVAGQVPLMIELKDQDRAMGMDIGLLEQATASAVSGYKGPLAVMSFNPNSVARMGYLLPEVPRGIVTSAYRHEDWPLPAATCDYLREIPDYDRTGACFISHEVDDLNSPRVLALKKRGAMICCWTVCSAAQEADARKIADNITFEGYRAPLRA